MIQSDHHQVYIYATSLGGPHDPGGSQWDPQGPWGPLARVAPGLGPAKPGGLPWSREVSEVRARPYSSGAHRPCSARAITRG
jgi:hypothetical protein